MLARDAMLDGVPESAVLGLPPLRTGDVGVTVLGFAVAFGINGIDA